MVFEGGELFCGWEVYLAVVVSFGVSLTLWELLLFIEVSFVAVGVWGSLVSCGGCVIREVVVVLEMVDRGEWVGVGCGVPDVTCYGVSNAASRFLVCSLPSPGIFCGAANVGSWFAFVDVL